MEIVDWAWLIVPLGVCRLMQVVLNDRILEGAREWISRHSTPGAGHQLGYAAYFVICPWCVSMWVGVATVLGLAFAAEVAVWVHLVFALSLAAVVIDRLVDRFTPDPMDAPGSPPVAPSGVDDAFRDHESP